MDSSPKTEKYDIYATMFGGIPVSELALLNPYWCAFPTLKNELFAVNNDGYNHLNTRSVKQTILENRDVKGFCTKYNKAFEDFSQFLTQVKVRAEF